jgi:anti-sigma-K factor RskA
MRYLKPELLNQLAGAYVLGTLSTLARLRFKNLAQAHPDMKRAVIEWENRLTPLAASVPPVMPPKRVWRAISARLGVTQPKAWFEKFNFWSMSAQLVLGVMLGAGIVHFIAKDEGVPESYVGFLSITPGAAPTVHASAMRKQTALFVKMIEPVALVAGQHLVLWGISKDNPPKRIGIIPAASGKSLMALSAPADSTFKGITILAISVESDGKGYSMAPMGEFVVQGPCVKLW